MVSMDLQRNRFRFISVYLTYIIIVFDTRFIFFKYTNWLIHLSLLYACLFPFLVLLSLDPYISCFLSTSLLPVQFPLKETCVFFRTNSYVAHFISIYVYILLMVSNLNIIISHRIANRNYIHLHSMLATLSGLFPFIKFNSWCYRRL